MTNANDSLPSTGRTTETAGVREWLGLAVLMLPLLVVSMDMTVLHLAVPALSADLRPTSSQLLWITDIYGFLIAGFLISMGALGDRIGRRKVLLGGAAVFGAVSVLAAFSGSAGTLIAARALLGVAGATLMPSTLSLIRNMFRDRRQRGMAIGIWAAGFTAGGAIGPPLGGVLLEHFWWGSVLLVGAPVMLVLLLLGPLLLPEFKDPGTGRIDLLSAVLSVAAVLPVVYGIKHAVEVGGIDVTSALTVPAGLVVGCLFARRQLTAAASADREPLLDLRLFTRPAFSGAIGMVALGGFLGYGTQFFIAQYLQLVHGLPPFQAALALIPQAVTGTIGSIVAPLLVRVTSRLTVILTGSALGAAALVTMTRAGGAADGGSPALIIVSFSVLFLGLSAIMTLSVDAVLGATPPERAGAASATQETTAELTGALGIALLGSLGAALYRDQVREALPDGLPEPAAEAARDTLGGAVAAARGLPDHLSGPLLDAARTAFTNGLHAVAWVSTGLALGIGALAILLRGSLRTQDEAGRTGGGAEGGAAAPEVRAAAGS